MESTRVTLSKTPSNDGGVRHKAHCQVWVSAWTGQDGRACSLVELFAGGVRMVEEQLAWGKLYSVGRLVLPEPIPNV